MGTSGRIRAVGAIASIAALAIAGCVEDGTPASDASRPEVARPPGPSATASPGAGATPATPTSPSPAAAQEGATIEFQVNLTENGFNGERSLVLHAPMGARVRVVLHHAEPFGDDHPIYFTCTSRAATVTATSGPAVMEFAATKEGTCSFFCTNGDCGPHEALQDGKIVVEA